MLAPHNGLIELFIIPASSLQVSCMWDSAYKRSLAANQKRVAYIVVATGFISYYVVAATGFISYYLNGTMPYNHKTFVECIVKPLLKIHFNSDCLVLYNSCSVCVLCQICLCVCVLFLGKQAEIDKALINIRKKFPRHQFPQVDLTPLGQQQPAEAPVLMPDIMQVIVQTIHIASPSTGSCPHARHHAGNSTDNTRSLSQY